MGAEEGKRRVTRRVFLGGAGAAAAGVWLGAAAPRPGVAGAAPALPADRQAALAVLGSGTLRQPGSLPYPHLPAGTDTMPQVEHIVVLVMENHSYDNILGLLPPRPNGSTLDGFTLDPSLVTSWNPYGVTAANPAGGGRLQRAFRMPGTTQLAGRPSQEWAASHQQFNGGANNGFVTSPSGPVAMGYYDRTLLPFTYSLAETFPVADRWFCSLLGQTDPNRRYLIAGTSAGMTDDVAVPGSVSGITSLATSPQPGNPLLQDVLLALPANGTIFDMLTAHGISWADYAASIAPGAQGQLDVVDTGATPELFPLDDAAGLVANGKPLAQFFTDCAAGTLPAFSFIDEDYSTQSQEDPQDMVVGEAFLAKVVEAVCTSPAWLRTMLVVTYDEHGGYYDHVPPPVALAPDAIPPVVALDESPYDGFHRYGFRVPALVVSPYARPGGATHVVHDHTSVLAMVERKWNLPALTLRDANANDLTDFLDMQALAESTPTLGDGAAVFAGLAAPGRSVPLGAVPPPGSQQPA